VTRKERAKSSDEKRTNRSFSFSNTDDLQFSMKKIYSTPIRKVLFLFHEVMVCIIEFTYNHNNNRKISNVGWSLFAAVKGFWSLCDNIYKCLCCYNRCHGVVIICC
jgi:hypothetical protein